VITAGVETLATCREYLTKRFFRRRVLPETSCLHYLLTEKIDPAITNKLRYPKTFQLLTLTSSSAVADEPARRAASRQTAKF